MYDVICPEAITVFKPPRVEPYLPPSKYRLTVVPSHPTYDKFLLGIRDSSDCCEFDLIFVEEQKYLESGKELKLRCITCVIRKIVLY